MSQRMGMADSRCTNYTSSRIFNDNIIKKLGLSYDDNLDYRRLLQLSEPSAIFETPTCSTFLYSEIVQDTPDYKQLAYKDMERITDKE
jgi:hypothetical protein